LLTTVLLLGSWHVVAEPPTATPPAAAAQIHHIRILTDLSVLPEEYRLPLYASEDNPLIQELIAPTGSMTSRLRSALNRLPAHLLGSIATLSVARYAGDGASGDTVVAGDTWGNNLIVNVALLGDPLQLNDTIAHEAVHCFHNLVDSNHDIDLSNVTAEAKTAVKTAEQARRTSSIGRILRRLQTSATIADTIYRDYAGEAWETRYAGDGDAAAVADAFASPYGSEEPREDLAELVTLFIDNSFANHPYCTQFDGLDGEIPRQKALAFAKLNFARALTLITEDQYKACVRGADPADAKMISMGSREYTGDLSHGTQTVSHEDLEDDWLMWRIRGASADAELQIRLRLRRHPGAPIGSAIGFYELDTAGALGFASDRFRPIAAQNVITFQRTDTSNDTEMMAYTRISGGGYVLITDFSADLVKGYAFEVPFHSIVEIEPPPTDTIDVLWFLWER
jgi:hypothetical protein